jgi:hypothetical protein
LTGKDAKLKKQIIADLIIKALFDYKREEILNSYPKTLNRLNYFWQNKPIGQ